MSGRASKVRVAVVFGGRSAEHAISCVSAGSVIAALDPDRYEVVKVGIAPDGRWVLADPEQRLEIIDGTDGMLARRFRVKETIPWFDGALLDNIVDYLTYVFAPVVLLWTTDSLPDGPVGWVVAALPLLASSYQFCRVDAKLVGSTGGDDAEDHFFLGFPSYWNVVAFYAIVLDASPTVVAVALVVCSVLVFVPVRYLYPSRMTTLRTTTLVFSVVWAVTYVVLLLQFPDPHPAVVAVSLAYLVYYVGLSVAFTVRGASAQRAESSA